MHIKSKLPFEEYYKKKTEKPLPTYSATFEKFEGAFSQGNSGQVFQTVNKEDPENKMIAKEELKINRKLLIYTIILVVLGALTLIAALKCTG